MTTIPIFPAAGLDLLGKLKKNNSTDWFHSHKGEYREHVQQPMLDIVAFVNGELAKFAPEYVNEKKNLVTRPNRDTRFSKDKSPYRTDIGAVFPFGGREKQEAAGFFFRILPDADHPAGELLRLTQYYFSRSFPKAIVKSPRFVPELVSSFRAATPFVRAVDAALGNKTR